MTETNKTAMEVPSPERQADMLAPVRRFRKGVVRVSLVLTAVAALIAYPYSAVACQGILLGGIGGLLGFWLMARRVESFASITPSRVKFSVYTGTITRLSLYALVLGMAYTLDRDGMVGFLSAVAGIFAIRFVVLVLGVASFKFRKKHSAVRMDSQL